MSTFQKVAIQGPGLKKEGVVVLQTLFIGFFVFIESVIRNGVGIITGIAICAAMYGSLRFGRPGTTYVSVVTPPLAFAATTLLTTIVLIGFRPSRVGIDLIAALASQAPFLIGSALYGWFVYFNQKAKKKPFKSENRSA
jgi:energy-coupling factor transporter transmembrane protein EcfT